MTSAVRAVISSNGIFNDFYYSEKAMIQLPIYVTQSSGCYGVTIPDLPGCHTSSLTAIGAIKSAETAAINFLKLAVEHKALLSPIQFRDHGKDAQYTGGTWYNIAVPRALLEEATIPAVAVDNTRLDISEIAMVSDDEVIAAVADKIEATDGAIADLKLSTNAVGAAIIGDPPQMPKLSMEETIKMLEALGVQVQKPKPVIGRGVDKTAAKKKRKAQKLARKANR